MMTMSAGALSAKALLAGSLATNNFGDTRPSGGLAGPVALLVLLVIAAVTVFLIHNMNARLRRLPERFPPAGSAAAGDQAAGGGATAGQAGATQETAAKRAGAERSAEQGPPASG